MTICLDTTTKSLVLNLTAVPTTEINYSVHYAIITENSFTEKNAIGNSNGTTNVTMVPAPLSGETVTIKNILLYNTNSSSVVANIKLLNNTTEYQLNKVTIAGNDTWKLADGPRGLTGPSPSIVTLTQAAYTALGTPDPNTFYIISG